MARALTAVFAIAACAPPVKPTVEAPVHARPRSAPPPTIPGACDSSYLQVGPPDLEPVAISAGQTAEVVTCKLQRGDNEGDFEWRAYLVQHGPRERADRIDEAIEGVGAFQEGAASAWLTAALPGSPIVVVEHASYAMDITSHSFIVYRLDTDPPQLVRLFSGGEAALAEQDGAATVRTCTPTYAQHQAGDSCLDHDEQVSTATVRWTAGSVAIDEHPAAKP